MAGAALQRIAAVSCPPDADSAAAKREAVRRMDEYLAGLPRGARLAVMAAAAAIDQGARLYPPARGRNLARLDDATAAVPRAPA